MKKTLFTSSAVFLWLGNALDAPQNVTLPAEDYPAIMEQLNNLHKRQQGP